MRPKKHETTGSSDLFRSRLDQIINMKHELVHLAGKIDWDWLDGEIAPSLQRLGFATETVANPAGAGPMLIAERREPGNRTTVLGYGHGDVIRGLEAEWAEGLSPWRLQRP